MTRKKSLKPLMLDGTYLSIGRLNESLIHCLPIDSRVPSSRMSGFTDFFLPSLALSTIDLDGYLLYLSSTNRLSAGLYWILYESNRPAEAIRRREITDNRRIDTTFNVRILCRHMIGLKDQSYVPTKRILNVECLCIYFQSLVYLFFFLVSLDARL